MGLSKKRRRKIVVDGEPFLWEVALDSDDLNKLLKVYRENKNFICHYPLFIREDHKRFMIVLGKEFGGTDNKGRNWRRYRCPKWENKDWCITPNGVADCIRWCLSDTKEMIEVNYLGVAIDTEESNVLM